MRFELHCFHPEPEFKAYKMIPQNLLESDAVAFKCPECEKETLLFLKFDKEERK